MESLENPARPPITMYRQGSKLDRLQAGLDPADQEIVNRLKKLRDEDKQLPPPTEDEIRRRLALLKDQDPDLANQPINVGIFFFFTLDYSILYKHIHCYFRCTKLIQEPISRKLMI